MKYMTFNSSCSYAGVANMLECHGMDVGDREIVLDMGLPFLFSRENGVYSAGPMLQTADWFNLYLIPRGFCMKETRVDREKVMEFLQSAECAMLGLAVTERSKHAVICTGMREGRYYFLNNKWQHSPEPETLLLTKEELQKRLGDRTMIAVLQKTQPKTADLTSYFQKSVDVLECLKVDLSSFCSQEKNLQELAEGRDRLFRAILLDAVTMLELLGESKLKEALQFVQRQFLVALKEGKPQILKDQISMPILENAIDAYEQLIQNRISNT